jgi:dienelactone hydrolase
MSQRFNVLCAAAALLAVTLSGCQSSNMSQAEIINTETASRTIEDGGTGPYTAVATSDSTLATHTVFRPADLSAFGKKNKLPIIAWGNGACANSPGGHINLLSEVASYGFLVIAIGPLPEEGQRGGGMGGGMMGGGGNSSTTPLIDAIDWAIAQNDNPTSIYYKKIDTTKIAVAGMSCGGLQAYEAAPDPRVTTTMICNSGLFNSSGGGPGGGGSGAPRMGGMPALGKDHLEKLHGSIIFILGGETDIAYANGMDDFKRIEKLPAFASNLGVGHGGTYMQPHGGDYAKVATAWLQWQLQGDKEAAKMFTGDPCGLSQMEGWTVEKKNIL